jgi:hypothetical protein
VNPRKTANASTIDAHRGEEGGISRTPLKDFNKLGHKNAVIHKNMRFPGFFHNPMYPLKRI